MKNILSILCEYIDKICKIGIVVSLMFALLGTLYQVFSRYLLQTDLMASIFPTVDFASFSYSWIEELVRYLFIWAVFFGIACVYKRKDHAKIDMLLNSLPGRWKQRTELFVELLNASFFIFVFVQGCYLISNTEGAQSPMLGMSMDIMYMSILFSCFACFINSVLNILENSEMAILTMHTRQAKFRKEGM